MSDSRIHSIDVDPGNPHNDQMAALTREELFQHVESARKTLQQGNGNAAAVMAVIAVALDKDAEFMPRIRLASLLAAALIELTAPGDKGIVK